MRDTSVAYLRLYKVKHERFQRWKEAPGRTLGSVSLCLAVSQPIVSTGATSRLLISLIVSYVSRHLRGAGCGISRDCRIGFALRGDFPDGLLFTKTEEDEESPTAWLGSLREFGAITA